MERRAEGEERSCSCGRAEVGENTGGLASAYAVEVAYGFGVGFGVATGVMCGLRLMGWSW